jgi:hypothetical protein
VVTSFDEIAEAPTVQLFFLMTELKRVLTEAETEAGNLVDEDRPKIEEIFDAIPPVEEVTLTRIEDKRENSEDDAAGIDAFELCCDARDFSLARSEDNLENSDEEAAGTDAFGVA